MLFFAATVDDYRSGLINTTPKEIWPAFATGLFATRRWDKWQLWGERSVTWCRMSLSLSFYCYGYFGALELGPCKLTEELCSVPPNNLPLHPCSQLGIMWSSFNSAHNAGACACRLDLPHHRRLSPVAAFESELSEVLIKRPDPSLIFTVNKGRNVFLSNRRAILSALLVSTCLEPS